MGTVEVMLPGGLAIDGTWHRTAQLRPINGWDEAFFCEEADSLIPAERTTTILERCVERVGPLTSVDHDTIRALTIGDREALLLHLRRLTFGEDISCVLTCPAEDCRQKMDLELKVGDLLQAPYSHVQEAHETTITGDDRLYSVRFRLPTGADQEAAAEVAAVNFEAAERLLLERCILDVVALGETNEQLSEIPAIVHEMVPGILAELDPQADLVLDLTCPECSSPFEVLFDAGEYLARELGGRRMDLYREVHQIAFHYHWSESDILAMTGQRRRLYLRLLAEELASGRIE